MTITSSAMIITDQIGYAARKSVWNRMLMEATIRATTRAQPWPLLSPMPAAAWATPHTTSTTPQVSKSKTSRSSLCFTTNTDSSSSAASPWMMFMPPTTVSMIEAKTTHPVQRPETASDPSGLGTCVLVTAGSLPENLVLFGGELLLGEDAVVAQLGQLPQLGDRIGRRLRLRRVLLRRRRLLVLLLRRIGIL